MGSKVVQDSSLTLVADKIRSKTGSSGSINFPYGFVNQIDRLSLGGETPTGVRNIMMNGTYDVTGDARAVVNVQPMLGTMDITENGTYNVADYSGATVNVPQGITPSGTKEITENGTYDITNYASAIVSVAGGGSEYFDIEEGEFEVFEDTVVLNKNISYEPYILEHSLGKVPMEFRLYISDCESVNLLATHTINLGYFYRHKYFYSKSENGRYNSFLYRTNSSSGSSGSVSIASSIYEEPTDESSGVIIATDGNIYIGNQMGTSTSHQYILRAGVTYKWFAIAERTE